MATELSWSWQQQIPYNDRGLEPVKLTVESDKFRTSRTGNRQTRTTQIDHDVFEGLPVRHWRKKPVNFNAVPEKDVQKTAPMLLSGYKELPLPRDYSMLPENSQVLLRAARMGLPKEKPTAEDDKENEDEEPSKAYEDATFVAHKWALVPDDEAPEPEYLAKRRKGLPSVYSGLSVPVGGSGQMRKTKIRKIDAEGNNYVWEVLVPEGQTVDGEVLADEASLTLPPAPGTIVEGLGVVNHEGVVIAGEQAAPAPTRRRPPIPKKKKHGPGRGRKKKADPAPGAEKSAAVNGVDIVHGHKVDGGLLAPERNHKAESGEQIDREDSVMHDAHQDEEEGSEEGSEGEDGEDGDREEGELSRSPSALPPSPKPASAYMDDANQVPEKVDTSMKPHEDAIAVVQIQESVSVVQPDNMEVDAAEPTTRPPSKTPDTDIGAYKNDSAGVSEAEHISKEEEKPEDDSLNEPAIPPPPPHAVISEHPSTPLSVTDEMLFSDPSRPPTVSSPLSNVPQDMTPTPDIASIPQLEETTAQ
ncbi:MAG: hypothetical protein Q9164_006826, partial [Protoblastenia rupestris]